MKRKAIRIALLSGGIWMCVFLMTGNPSWVYAQGNGAAKDQSAIAGFYERAASDVDSQSSATVKLNTIVTLKKGSQSFISVLKSIARQAGLKLSYSEQFVPLNKKVDIKLTKVTAKKALWDILRGTSLRFGISTSGQLVLIQRNDNQPQQVVADAQQVTIKGNVTDSESGESLPGANVLVKGTNMGTATDSKGNYTVNVPSSQDTLIFSYIGYQSQTIAINGRTVINVRLTMQSVSGQQLVVIGYGTQKKALVTTSISSVQASDLKQMPVTRVDQSLQGRTSGVTVAASSGAPGAASTVRIRGTTSINNSDPLYIVDGVPVDVGGIGYLNPEDIASIEVLKDAASAAIYGTRAANGVVLVTTKSGSAGQMQIHYSTYLGIQQPAKKLSLLDATQYATLRNESSVAAGNGIIFANPQSLGKGTNWQKEIFNNHAAVMNQDLSISGGNSKATYYASLGYYDQQGIVASPISHDKRLTIRLNTTFNLKKWLKIGENLGFTYDKNRGSLNANSEFGGPLSSAINLDPITPVVVTDKNVASQNPYSNNPVVLNSNGQPYGISSYVGQEMTNPLAYVQTHLGNNNWSDNLVGNMYAEIEPIKGLRFRTNIGAKQAFWGTESFTPVFYLSATQNNTVNANLYREMHQGLIWNWDNTITYMTDYGENHMTFLVGTSAQANNASSVNGTFQGLPVNTFGQASMNFSVPTANRIAGGQENQPYALNSYFGRVNYDYQGKYLLTGVLRIDGSSRFGSANRYGRFPSVSVGWVPTLEKFWPQNKVVSFLKIRASYGINGNDQSLSDFQYESTIGGGRDYVFGPGTIYSGYSPNAPSNPNLKWEQTSQIDLGFDANLFNDFTMTFDVYKKNTSGMLRQVQIPGYVGATGQPYGNVASLEDKGAELDLTYQKMIGTVGVNLNGNVSYVQNTVTNIGDQAFITGATFQASAYEISRIQVGEPIGEFYGFKALGIFQTQAQVNNYKNNSGQAILPDAKPGDFIWADLNGDGQITSEDRTFLGNPTPPWTFGITATINWKNFDLRIFGQGVSGNKIYQGLRRLDILTANYTTAALGRWTGSGTSNTFPRLTDSDPNHNFTYPSSFYLSDGSYFRIKTLQLGYSLPESIAHSFGIRGTRFYISGNNLLTFTKYTGFDPEIGGSSYGIDRGIYPQARSYMFGWNITF
ncbi:MAG TPA: TonB-dependent receptor [Balneolales bacterium]|nr:TonB-dependent receptor [Balneolales bacterium]